MWYITLFGNLVSNHTFSNYSLFNLHFFWLISFLNNPTFLSKKKSHFRIFSYISSFIPPLDLTLFHFGFSGRGIYILYEDVKSCPYEDVHVLWSILVESHTSLPSKNGAHMQPVDRIWESSSYLHFPFLSSPAMYINIFDIYEVYTHINTCLFFFCSSGFLQFHSCYLRYILVYYGTLKFQYL